MRKSQVLQSEAWVVMGAPVDEAYRETMTNAGTSPAYDNQNRIDAFLWFVHFCPQQLLCIDPNHHDSQKQRRR
jgi:hypothetical protein